MLVIDECYNNAKAVRIKDDEIPIPPKTYTFYIREIYYLSWVYFIITQHSNLFGGKQREIFNKIIDEFFYLKIENNFLPNEKIYLKLKKEYEEMDIITFPECEGKIIKLFIDLGKKWYHV